MSIPANIFELLQDENDSEVKKAPTSRGVEQPKKGPTTAQPAKTQQKAVDRTTGEARGTARPKSDQPQQRRPQQQREGSGAPAPYDGERKNRPPRQQQGEGRERREKQAERTENPKHRAFDRRSGTGRGKETKRGGAGRGNWGTQEDDQKAQVETATTEQVTEENTEQAKPEATPEAQPEAEPQLNPEDEEDAKLKTFDDYRKSLKAPVVALPPPRVVEDKPEWSKFTALKRDEDEAPQKKASKKEEKEEDASKKNRAEEVLDIKFSEGSPKDRRDRDSRDSRGGFRGRGRGDSPRGGRGGKRGGNTSRSSAPNFSDERSFPSLSTATKA